MIRYYHYRILDDAMLKEFRSALQMSITPLDADIRWYEDSSLFTVETEDFHIFEQSLSSLIVDFNYEISIMASYGESSLIQFLLDQSENYQLAPLFFYGDVVLRLLIDHNPNVIQYMKKELDKLTQEEIESVLVFARAGLNINKASEALFVHRNTLQNRLNTIYDKTGINYRDAMNIFALLLYFSVQ